MSAGIGKAGTIHVQMQAKLLAGIADRAQLLGLVHSTDFGGLGQAHHARLGVVDVLALQGDFTNGRGRQLALLGPAEQQLGTIGEELGGAAFVGLDVGNVGADHAVVTLAERRQRQGIRSRAIESEKHLAVGIEQRPKVIGRARCPLIVAVRPVMPLIRSGHGLPGFWAYAGIVVAGKLLIGGGHRVLVVWHCRTVTGQHVSL